MVEVKIDNKTLYQHENKFNNILINQLLYKNTIEVTIGKLISNDILPDIYNQYPYIITYCLKSYKFDEGYINIYIDYYACKNIYFKNFRSLKKIVMNHNGIYIEDKNDIMYYNKKIHSRNILFAFQTYNDAYKFLESMGSFYTLKKLTNDNDYGYLVTDVIFPIGVAA